MDELIEEVITRTGLNEDQARAATDAVTGYLKEHLPEPAAKALDHFLGGPAAGVAARDKKAQTAAVAATTAAINAVVLPHAH